MSVLKHMNLTREQLQRELEQDARFVELRDLTAALAVVQRYVNSPARKHAGAVVKLKQLGAAVGANGNGHNPKFRKAKRIAKTVRAKRGPNRNAAIRDIVAGTDGLTADLIHTRLIAIPAFRRVSRDLLIVALHSNKAAGYLTVTGKGPDAIWTFTGKQVPPPAARGQATRRGEQTGV